MFSADGFAQPVEQFFWSRGVVWLHRRSTCYTMAAETENQLKLNSI
jgi:hypothetical protein